MKTIEILVQFATTTSLLSFETEQSEIVIQSRHFSYEQLDLAVEFAKSLLEHSSAVNLIDNSVSIRFITLA